MRGSRLIAAAAVGGLALLCLSAAARAQSAPQYVTRIASLASGSIAGVVQDDTGVPIPGATVLALGATTAVTVTDRSGRFELRTLSPGPYLVRARVTGFMISRGQIIEVQPSARSTSSIALRHATTTKAPPILAPPVLAAAVGGAVEPGVTRAADPAPAAQPVDSPDPSADADHGEIAWRLNHVRRGILKNVVVPDDFLADGIAPGTGVFSPALAGSRAVGSPTGLAANLFAGTPLTGQFNLLMTGSFDSPQQLFTADSFSRSIAYVSLAARVGDHADWSMRGALTQGDISSWFVAGAYATRAPARHRYDLGLSYSTQRYDGGNPAALREVTDGNRNVGEVYGFDTFALTPAVSVTYGTRFTRYDYLAESGQLSPRLELTVSPTDHFRVNALASRRALAPGAEEFLPPINAGLWLPPQRTFSSIVDSRPLQPERTDHLAVEAERDFGASTVSLSVFRQHVDDQLVTMFGLDVPAVPGAQLGHYFVGNAGDVDATGWSAAFRTALASRMHGSVRYSLTQANWNRNDDAGYLLLMAPAVARPSRDRVHNVSTSIETSVPETSTRVLLICRLINARSPVGSVRPTTYDSRFDVQVYQSLPFMDFGSARWEMLLAVRNTFREATSDSSAYDEVLVVKAPKRIIGGLTLRF